MFTTGCVGFNILVTASQDWTALQFASPGARRNHAIALAAMGQVQQYGHGSFGQGR